MDDIKQGLCRDLEELQQAVFSGLGDKKGYARSAPDPLLQEFDDLVARAEDAELRFPRSPGYSISNGDLIQIIDRAKSMLDCPAQEISLFSPGFFD
jgi:hypothetical protein